MTASLRSLFLALACCQSAHAAAPASAGLLPASTRLHVTTPDLASLTRNWERTTYARLVADPTLAKVVAQATRGIDGLGLDVSLEELRAASGGEVSWALVQPAGASARVFTVDTTGKAEAAGRLLDGVAARLKKTGYTTKRGDIRGAAVVTFTGPKGEQVAHATTGSLLVLSDSLAVLEDMLGRGQAGSKDGLDAARAYRAVRDRVEARGKGRPDLFFFLDPMNLRRSGPKRANDPLDVLRAEGFDAVGGVGGGVAFGVEPFEALYHVVVNAPPPYQKAMRALHFLPVKNHAPPAWAPANVAEVGAIGFDAENAFQTVGPLIDALVLRQARGSFDDIMKDVRDDPDGRRVDIRREVLGRLDKQLSVVSAAGPKIEGMLLAVRVREARALQAVLARLLQGEEGVQRRRMGKYEYWEYPPGRAKEKGAAKAERPNQALGIANDTLYVATNVRLLENVLANRDGGGGKDAATAGVLAQLDRLAPKDAVLRWVSHPDLSLRDGYEKVRQGQAFAASSPSAQLVQRILGEVKADVFDPKLLPPFERVRPYLRPSGLFAVATEDGWALTGFSLKR